MSYRAERVGIMVDFNNPIIYLAIKRLSKDDRKKVLEGLRILSDSLNHCLYLSEEVSKLKEL